MHNIGDLVLTCVDFSIDTYNEVFYFFLSFRDVSDYFISLFTNFFAQSRAIQTVTRTFVYDTKKYRNKKEYHEEIVEHAASSFVKFLVFDSFYLRDDTERLAENEA